jgi:hypothetical protein
MWLSSTIARSRGRAAAHHARFAEHHDLAPQSALDACTSRIELLEGRLATLQAEHAALVARIERLEAAR